MAIGEGILDKLESDKVSEALALIDKYFKEKYNLKTQQVLELLDRKEIFIPVSIFDNKGLGSLELVTKYLKEDLNKTYHEIAKLLNRDDRTIWSTYNNAVKKLKTRLAITAASHYLPISIFKERKFSVLESIILYLKKQGLSFTKISSLLNRDYQTIWTTYKKAEAKNEE
ncbi:hypothetical protein JW930_07065 [Candidatus Woesearchaeota archaeon]|nr:hypothetical protein [Candidatus Woesearchaeota archaeon]